MCKEMPKVPDDVSIAPILKKMEEMRRAGTYRSGDWKRLLTDAIQAQKPTNSKEV